MMTVRKLEQLERLRSEDTPAASWLPIPLTKSQLQISNFWILKQALHTTHLLKLLDKMCKYEMDLMSIVEDTEQTRFYPQTDRLRWSGGIMTNLILWSSPCLRQLLTYHLVNESMWKLFRSIDQSFWYLVWFYWPSSVASSGKQSWYRIIDCQLWYHSEPTSELIINSKFLNLM